MNAVITSIAVSTIWLPFPDIHTTNYGSVIWGYDPNEQKAAPKK